MKKLFLEFKSVSENRKFLFFLAFAFLFLCFHLGGWGLTESSEARYAEISREMLLAKDFLHPMLLGIYHYHKPPLTYYITMLGYEIFGINEFGARFFLQIALIIQLVLVFKIAKRLTNDPKVPLMAAIIYFTFPIVLISSRNLTTDAYLTTWIMASIYFWLRYIQEPKHMYRLYLYFLFMGLAFETKGPVALLFILIFIISYRLIFKNKFRINKHYVLGFILFFIIGASWFFALLVENNTIMDYFINYQLISRIKDNSFNRGKSFWYFIIILPALLFPWFFIIFNWSKKQFKQLFKLRNPHAVLLISSLILLLVFSIFKTKLILYILPIFWMLSILIADSLSQINQKVRNIIHFSYLIIATSLSSLSILSHYYDLNFTLSIAQIVSIVAVYILFLILFVLLNRKKYQSTVFIALGFAVLLIVFANYFMTNNDNSINSIREMALFIKNNNTKDQNVLVYNRRLSSLPFYLDQNIITLNDGNNTTKRETFFQKNNNWKKNLIDVASKKELEYLNTILKRKEKFIIIRKKDIKSKFFDEVNDRFEKQKEFGKWVLYYSN
jgi:4-amino-4-deoxy-L-arabinose transferase